MRQVRLTPHGAAGLPLANAGDVLGRWIPPQGTGSAVNDHRRPVLQIESPRLDAGDKRNVERPGEDGDVRRCPARRRAQAEHVRTIEGGCIGRRQVLGDQDGARWVLVGLGLGAGEVAEHATAYVAQVVGACREQFVRRAGQTFCMRRERRLPSKRRTLARRHRLGSHVEKSGVVEQLPVGGKDRRLAGGAITSQARLERGELRLRLLQCRVERAPLLP